MPNDLGLFDVLGNVEEWCQNRYENNPTADVGPGPTNQPQMVIRGGSFASDAPSVRSVRRMSNPPQSGRPLLGFRVARTLVTPASAYRKGSP